MNRIIAIGIGLGFLSACGGNSDVSEREAENGLLVPTPQTVSTTSSSASVSPSIAPTPTDLPTELTATLQPVTTPITIPQVVEPSLSPTTVPTVTPVATLIPVATAEPTLTPTAIPTPINQAPVITLNFKPTVESESLVSIDASGSHDPENGELLFSWSQMSGTEVELITTDTTELAFDAPVVTEDTRLQFLLTVTDAEGLSETQMVEVIVQENPLAYALRTGDAFPVELTKLESAALEKSQEAQALCQNAISTVFPGGVESIIVPNYRIQFLTSSSIRNVPVHVSRNEGVERVYSYVGEKDSGARYSVWGTDFFSFDQNSGPDDLSEPYNQYSKNAVTGMLRFILKAEPDADIFSQNLTLLADRSSTRTAINEWLSDNNIVNNWTVTDDQSIFDSGAYDIYIERGSFTKYEQATAAGKPVIILHSWLYYHGGHEVLAHYDLAFDWWKRGFPTVEGSVDEHCQQFSLATKLTRTLMNVSENGAKQFDYSGSSCASHIGRWYCKDNEVLTADGEALSAEFSDGLGFVKRKIAALNADNTNVFTTDDDLTKLMVLMGDKYREQIVYPMDKIASPSREFHRAQFADTVVNFFRTNVAQGQLGSFTSMVTNLLQEPGETKIFTREPTAYDEWTATGFYIPPGRVVSVMRTDSSDAQVKFVNNFLRASTRQYNTNGYTRPLYMKSSEVTIEPGETIDFSTPYGGPVYVYTQGETDTPLASVSLTFENVTQNPLLENFDSASIEVFSQDLDATSKDWVDIKTPFAEIHSLKSNMIEAFEDHNPDNAGYDSADVQGFIDELNGYLIINNYAYAGFVDPALPPHNAEVQNFCTEKNLACSDQTIHAKPKVQHINSDEHAYCGGLCAGNPFDSGKAIDPLGWGENHEMGHNLQRNRLKIYGGRSNESSNNIFPIYTSVKWMQDEGIDYHPTLVGAGHPDAFEILQNAIANNVAATDQHPLWVETGTYSKAFERLSFFVQLAYANQSWEVWTKMYLIEREFTHAIKSEAEWLARRDRLGFSNYALADAQGISGNDFMAVALSFISDKNHTAFLAAWGVEVSAAATNQILANGAIEDMPLLFYVVTDTLPSTIPSETRPLDGVSAWE